MVEAIRYSEALTVQVQRGFRFLIDGAAARAGTKPTEWNRKALAERHLHRRPLAMTPSRWNAAGVQSVSKGPQRLSAARL
jgi:hypothetical protein